MTKSLIANFLMFTLVINFVKLPTSRENCCHTITVTFRLESAHKQWICHRFTSKKSRRPKTLIKRGTSMGRELRKVWPP